MANWQISQKVVSQTSFWKKYKEKSKFRRKRGGKFSFFLVYFKNKEGIIFVFL